VEDGKKDGGEVGHSAPEPGFGLCRGCHWSGALEESSRKMAHLEMKKAGCEVRPAFFASVLRREES